MNEDIELRNLASLSDEALSALRREVGEHQTAEDVFRWLRSTGRHDGTEDVVVQDEFTHDGIFPYERGLFLVYGLT